VKVVVDAAVHERQLSVVIGWPELLEAIQTYVAAGLDGVSAAESEQLKVSIEQLEEGSPRYKLQQWRAVVSGKLALDVPA
jgi:hypothetical protein